MSEVKWDDVQRMMDETSPVSLGQQLGSMLYDAPGDLLATIRRYKFAAKMINRGVVLDVGCGEGLGTWLLAKECGRAVGVDPDQEAIGVAASNWSRGVVSFECGEVELIRSMEDRFDGVVLLDVLDALLPQRADQLLNHLPTALQPFGAAVIGLANPTAEAQRRSTLDVDNVAGLRERLAGLFHHVFVFGDHGAGLGTTDLEATPYLMAVVCHARQQDQ